MNVTYSEKARESSAEYALMQQLTAQLDEIVGRSADQVKVEWDRKEDAQGRPLYVLRLTDWSGSVSASLSPEEVQSPIRLRIRLLRLWGDLLQIRSHRQLDDMLGPGE